MTGGWQASDLLLFLGGFFVVCCLASAIFVAFRVWVSYR